VLDWYFYACGVFRQFKRRIQTLVINFREYLNICKFRILQTTKASEFKFWCAENCCNINYLYYSSIK
jgi:hypothetical protein